jgi:TM2 domain-containing membrane protein YozV
MFCRNCGTPAEEGAQFCSRCGASLQQQGAPESPPPPPAGTPISPPPPPPIGVVPKQKLVAGLLGILLGWLGIHRFYLGYNTIGAVQLVLGVAGLFTCGITTVAAAIWGIIDGVQILTGSIATDAQGIPLRD